MVIVLVQTETDRVGKDLAFKMKDAVGRASADPQFFVHDRKCYAVVQASLERRALFQQAVRFSGIFAELSGDAHLTTKRDYGQNSLTILGWSTAGATTSAAATIGDKNAHLQPASSGSGRRRRVVEGGERRVGSSSRQSAYPSASVRRP